ncbi:putative vitamin B6 photo-protection and homoeostasis [Lyophyllum shimeji]|uniref:Vitamin B6 photo-protection and homoeostasis n=1 Tax=Lyophyllum shimeji TaxID=47721 RepID=A0A9P3ULG4_LYOSH|nr:putative vitamin B6 photo-protection and homoeostasis [Lyophyllum shimeji]
MVPNCIVVEKDDAGHYRRTFVSNNKTEVIPDRSEHTSRRHVKGLLTKVFLPSGYPNSVSPDYLRYQVLNASQAFCNSLAGLLSSRAVLEGFGVGDPSATATHALLLSIVQDVCNRLTTILGAYAFGSSLVPEAKTYRFLADVLNDAAVILDTLSPLSISSSLPIRIPGLRIGALCLSASFKALCGVLAGGSKAAITLHFATPLNGNGDVGDLNAKDSSKETVLSLIGVLLGTLIVPRLDTPRLTYGALFFLVGLHLIINYLGVRGLELRSLNRQRAGIAWKMYRLSGGSRVPLPAEVAKLENILGQPDVFRDANGRTIGRCTIGSSFSDVFPHHFPARLLEVFDQERYLLWGSHQSLRQSPGRDVQTFVREGPIHLHILLKEGYSGDDQLRAWAHAADLCATLATEKYDSSSDDAVSLIRTTLRKCAQDFPDFANCLRGAGWNVHDPLLMAGLPRAVLTRIEPNNGVNREDKKIR